MRQAHISHSEKREWRVVREVKVKSVRSLERGLLVMETIQRAGNCSLAELHAHTQLSRATILRSLRTLEEQGWVTRDEDRGYRPGPKMARKKRPSLRLQIRDAAGAVLDELGKHTPWPADVAVLQGTSMVIVHSSRPSAPFLIKSNVEGRMPCLLRSALGRAYIAFCPSAEREALLAALRQSTDPDDRLASAPRWVDRMIAECLDQGYAVREPGYYAGFDDEGPEVCAIATPIMRADNVIACMNLMWVAGTQTAPEFASRHLKQLKAAAAHLSTMVNMM